MRGTHVGPFVLDHPLGRGGMGEVWRGRHVGQQVPVAIKLARVDPEAFAVEVEAVARLEHASIVHVYDHGLTEDGLAWMAMELCSGGSLAHLPPTGWVGVRRASEAILAALAHAHAHDVLHRDLTPANVLIGAPTDERPGLKLSDFGLSFARPRAPNVVLGTPPWMAPELFQPDPDLGPGVDFYALGAVLWFLVTGDAPFGIARPPEAFALAHAEAPLPAFRPRLPVPGELPDLLRWLLSKNASDRPRTAAEVIEALALIDGAAPPPPRGPAHRPPMRLVGTGLGLFGLRPVPLVGRDGERTALLAEIQQVVDGQGPRVVAITGDAGLGASRLARWALEHVRETGIGEGLVAPAPLTRALARHLGVSAPSPRLEERLRRLGAEDPYEWMGASALLFPEDNDRSGALRLTTAAERAAVTRRLLARLSARTPFVLILDHHDGDGLLDGLAEASDLDHLLILLAGTPAPGHPTLVLRPLALPHQIQLVEGLLALSGDLAAQVRARAGGNPGFAVQIVADLVARGLLEAGEDGFVLREGAAPTLPDSLHAWWSDRLAAAGRMDTLELAAVLGPTVDSAEWADACAAAELDEPEPDRVLESALAEGTVARWTFVHPLARESLLRHAEEAGRLARWHDAAAAALIDRPGSNDRLGPHLLAAGRRAEAVPVLLGAARRAVRAGDDGAARPLVERLLEAVGNDTDAAATSARLFRAQLLTRQGRYAEASVLAEPALQAIQGNGWDTLLPSVLSLCGELARLAGDPTRARGLLEPALARAEADGDLAEAAHIHRHLGALAAWTGDLGLAGRRHKAAQVLFLRTNQTRGAIASMIARADVARRAGTPALAEELAAQVEPLLARTPWRRGQADLDTLRGDLQRDAGAIGPAVRHYRAALTAYEAAGTGDVVPPLLGLVICLDRNADSAQARQTLALAIARGAASGFRAPLTTAIDVALLAAEQTPFDAQLVDLTDLLHETETVHPDIADALERAAARSPDHRLAEWALVHRRRLR